jgi:hypothetical protein
MKATALSASRTLRYSRTWGIMPHVRHVKGQL